MKRGWKIILGAALLAIILAVLMWGFRPSRQILVYSPPLCNTKTEKAIETKLLKDFPGSLRVFFNSTIAEVIMINDMRCEDNFGAANFAIVLENDGKILFGVFQIYFSFKEELIHYRTMVPWKEFSDKNDPQIDALWHDFIKTIYPGEMKKPG